MNLNATDTSERKIALLEGLEAHSAPDLLEVTTADWPEGLEEVLIRRKRGEWCDTVDLRGTHEAIALFVAREWYGAGSKDDEIEDMEGYTYDVSRIRDEVTS